MSFCPEGESNDSGAGLSSLFEIFLALSSVFPSDLTGLSAMALSLFEISLALSTVFPSDLTGLSAMVLFLWP